VANRGVILDTFGRKRSRQARDGGSFGIVLVDLDHFKYVNESCGHLAGDAVSRETTQRMMPSVRPYDTVGRYGGQKFLIVAPSSDALGAQGLYERIRRAIAEQAIALDSVAIAITASFGVAASSEARPLDPQEMLKLADDALRNFASVER
jgi:diguanylate cyclase (GGDEF)-like protein